ncbi:unnamed protein product, partial [Rotaria sp. Silwood1]
LEEISNQTPKTIGLISNTTTTPMKSRVSHQSMTKRLSGSSTSAYSPLPNSDMLMVCAKCRQVLPRYSICMMSLTTYIEDAS